MTFILTQPRSGVASSDGYISISGGVIASSVQETIDSVPISINTIKWIVELIDNTNQKMRSYEIMATNEFNTNISYTVYGIVGKKILHGISVVLNGSNIDLNITNNEMIDLNYKISRIQLQ